MRILALCLMTAAGLPAQESAPAVSAAEKVEEFERNLAGAMRPRGVLPKLELKKDAAPAAKVCSIPLLRVGPAKDFKSNMPLIPPDSKGAFTAVEVIPPAPVCDEQTRK